MKKITVLVDDDGNLHADFSGFQGRTCESEEEKFRRVLAGLGLVVKTEKLVKKSENRTQSECNQDISTRNERGIRQ